VSFLLPLLFAALEGEDSLELVARLQRRDPEALAEIYKRYGKLVYSF